MKLIEEKIHQLHEEACNKQNSQTNEGEMHTWLILINNDIHRSIGMHLYLSICILYIGFRIMCVYTADLWLSGSQVSWLLGLSRLCGDCSIRVFYINCAFH